MSTKRKILLSSLVLAAVGYFSISTLSARHPHFSKSVTVKIGDVEAKLAYFTAPANEKYVTDAKVGAFSAGFGTLTLSGDLTAGDVTLKAGDYTIGAIKNGDGGWTMGVHQGKLGFNDTPDMAKVIKLSSEYTTSNGNAPHIYFDIMPGHGKQEGKTTLIWHFGKHYLAGVIS
ncbi:MAG: hypothetical protein ACE5I1_07910 [bacterium]